MMHRAIHLPLYALLALALLPMYVAAQQQTETVVAQGDMTLPTGTAVIGTVTAKRTCGDTITTEWSFNGMVNGTAATASGTAIERWQGDGAEDIELTAITSWQMALAQPPLITIQVRQTGPNLVTVNGIPAAIDRPLAPPCSGVTQYVLSNPGRGTQPISELPNTATPPVLTASDVSGVLVVLAGLLLGGLLVWRRFSIGALRAKE